MDDTETIVSEFLDEWGVTHKRAVGDLDPWVEIVLWNN